MSETLHLLVVDDEQAMEILFEAFLSDRILQKVITLHYFSSALDCLAFLKSHNRAEKTIILSDINMPKMNGFEFIDEIGRLYPSIVFYMMSAYDNPDYIEKAMNKGARGFYVKPFNFEEILAMLDQFVLE